MPIRARTVLFLSHETECGGAEMSLLDLLEGLSRERYRPVLVTSGAGPLADRAAALGVAVRHVPMRFAGKWAKLKGILRARREVAALACDEAASLLHANTLIAGYVALGAARRARLPCVWHVRDLRYPWLARRACGAADRVVANSHATATSLRLPASAVQVVYNGVSPRFFRDDLDGAAVRTSLGVGPGTVVLGIVGRLDPWKGHIDLLRACARLDAAVRLWIVGDVAFETGRGRPGEFRDRLRSEAERLGIADRVSFLGRRDDIPEVLAALDVLVHPSSDPEPFGRSMAEAQACGRPVVATRAGGIPEVVEEGVTGLLVPCGDPPALAAALAELIADPDRRGAMGRAGRERAVRLFTTEAHARGIERVYDGLLAGA